MLMNEREVMARLRVSRGTVWNLIRRGRLHPSKVGPRCNRFDSAEVEAIVTALCHEAPPVRYYYHMTNWKDDLLDDQGVEYASAPHLAQVRVDARRIAMEAAKAGLAGGGWIVLVLCDEREIARFDAQKLMGKFYTRVALASRGAKAPSAGLRD